MSKQEKCPECGDALTRWHEPDGSRCRMTQAEARIAELQTIVDKLPKYSDGTPVTDCRAKACLLYRNSKGLIIVEMTFAGWRASHNGTDWWLGIYPTREAAEAARKGTPDG